MSEDDTKDPSQCSMNQKETAVDKVIAKVNRTYLPCISCKEQIPADSIWCPYCKIQQGR